MMRIKQLYQFIVPDNGVSPLPIFTRHAGGFTQLSGYGGWKEPGTGHIVHEPVHVIQCACSVDEFRNITRDLQSAFPGEKEWMVSHIGHAHFITTRKEKPHVSTA